MKKMQPWHWVLIVIAAIAIIILLIYVFKPKTPVSPTITPGSPAPASSNWISSLIDTLGPGVSNWIFGPKTSSGGGCQQGVVTGSNPCIDDCGFPISSDVNPACV